MTDNKLHTAYPLDSGKVTAIDDDDGEMDGLIAAYDAATDEDYTNLEKAIPFNDALEEIAIARGYAAGLEAAARLVQEPVPDAGGGYYMDKRSREECAARIRALPVHP